MTRQPARPKSERWCGPSRAATLCLTAGLVLQELLQGFAGPKSRSQIVEGFSALPLIVPDRDDHIQLERAPFGRRRPGDYGPLRCRRERRLLGVQDVVHLFREIGDAVGLVDHLEGSDLGFRFDIA